MSAEEESSRHVYVLGFCDVADLIPCMVQMGGMGRPYAMGAPPAAKLNASSSTLEAVVALKRKCLTEEGWGKVFAERVPLLRVQMVFLLHPGAPETMSCLARLMQHGANVGMCETYRVISGGRMSEHDERTWAMRPAAMSALRREVQAVNNQLYHREHQHFQCLQTLEMASANLEIVTQMYAHGHDFNVRGYEMEVTRLEMECIAIGCEATELKKRLDTLVRLLNKQREIRRRERAEQGAPAAKRARSA